MRQNASDGIGFYIQCAILLGIIIFLYSATGCTVTRERTIVRERKDISLPKVREQDKTVAIFVKRGGSRDIDPLMGIIRQEIRKYCGLNVIGSFPLLPAATSLLYPPHTYRLEIDLHKVQGAAFTIDPRTGAKRSLQRAIVDAVLVWPVTHDIISEGRGEADSDRENQYQAIQYATRQAVINACTVVREIREEPLQPGVEIPAPQRMLPRDQGTVIEQ